MLVWTEWVQRKFWTPAKSSWRWTKQPLHHFPLETAALHQQRWVVGVAQLPMKKMDEM